MIEWITQFENGILHYFQSISTPVSDAIWTAITYFGESGIFWIALSLLFMCLPKYRRAGFSMGAALLMGLVLCNLILKPLVARIRPYDYQLEHFGVTISLLIATPHDFSFPSGHTIASFEAATALLLHDRKFGIPAMILAALVAFSRLYLYVHYPTDVLASLVLGVGLAVLGTWLVKKGYILYENKKQITYKGE